MNLITLTNPVSPAAEAYRSLRTNLHFAALEAPLKTVIIAAPGTHESAALVAANLAVTLAQSEKQVILVDANLRQPILHTLLGLDNSAGLASMLRDGSTPLPLQNTAVPGLRLMASGPAPSVPSDIVSSPRMVQLIQTLSEQADIVIFSAPPLAVTSDAAILASRVDAAVLVIQAGKTQREQAQQAKEILARAKVRVLGAVMMK